MLKYSETWWRLLRRLLRWCCNRNFGPFSFLPIMSPCETFLFFASTPHNISISWRLSQSLHKHFLSHFIINIELIDPHTPFTFLFNACWALLIRVFTLCQLTIFGLCAYNKHLHRFSVDMTFDLLKPSTSPKIVV